MKVDFTNVAQNVPAAVRQWSPFQVDIFDFVEKGSGNAIVKAVAGSGKTTTIVEALKRIPRGRDSIFLAFNKSIATELKARGVNARTFHSLTYSPVTRFKKARDVTQDKVRQVLAKLLTGEEEEIYGPYLAKLVGLGRQAGIGCLLEDTKENWRKLAEHHDLELESDRATERRAIELVSYVLEACNKSELVDFDDLLYLAVKEGLTLPKSDFVFVDEAQDTNAIQREILRKIMKPSSRIIAVGDPCQAIYGFRGADSDSLDLIAEEFECCELPLTISYRCPQAVVRYAQEWVPYIEAHAAAPEGSVTGLGFRWDNSTFKPDDLVVCRTTRPIITLGYRLLRAHVPVRILGREIGQGLKTLVRKLRPKSLKHLATKLEEWAERETEKAKTKKNEAKAASISDKASALLALIDSLENEHARVDDLLHVIDSLFADGRGKVILATIHKAKGLEADRVFWLCRSMCPLTYARKTWQKQQEYNLCYVAATRAKSELILIEEPEPDRG